MNGARRVDQPKREADDDCYFVAVVAPTRHAIVVADNSGDNSTLELHRRRFCCFPHSSFSVVSPNQKSYLFLCDTEKQLLGAAKNELSAAGRRPFAGLASRRFRRIGDVGSLDWAQRVQTSRTQKLNLKEEAFKHLMFFVPSKQWTSYRRLV